MKGLAIRKDRKPMEVRVGDVVFLVNPLTYAAKAEARNLARKAGGGVVDDEVLARTLYRGILAGWRGLRYEDTGEEVPFGPCPDCAGAGTPGTGVTPATCGSCGGTKDCRDWALAVFPDSIWNPIVAEAGRTAAREENLLGN